MSSQDQVSSIDSIESDMNFLDLDRNISSCKLILSKSTSFCAVSIA